MYKFRFVSSELKDDVKKYLDINEDEFGGLRGSPVASELSALSGGSDKGQGTDNAQLDVLESLIQYRENLQ
nr:hypothetical protein [uncultured Acetatifactor sp.]